MLYRWRRELRDYGAKAFAGNGQRRGEEQQAAELERKVGAVRPASRRVSAKVRIFIEHLEKTFALCSQFNPRPS